MSISCTHHAGGGSGGAGTDHQVADPAAPVLTALLIGQQGEGGLLQQGGGVRSCNTHTYTHTELQHSLKSSKMKETQCEAYALPDWLTIVAGQAPAAGHTLHASGEVVCGLGHAHGGHVCVQLGGAGQLDEQDVVVDGVAVVAGVLEYLSGSDMVDSGRPIGNGRDATRSSCLQLTLPTLITWMLSALEERSCSPRITRCDVLQRCGQKHVRGAVFMCKSKSQP